MAKSKLKRYLNDSFVENFLKISDKEICTKFMEVVMKPFKMLNKTAYYEDLELGRTSVLGRSEFYEQLSKALEQTYPKLVKLFKLTQYSIGSLMLGESVTLSRLMEESKNSPYLQLSEIGKISPDNSILFKDKIESIKNKWEETISRIPHINDVFAKAFLKLDDEVLLNDLKEYIKTKTNEDFSSLTQKDLCIYLSDFIRTSHKDIWDLIQFASAYSEEIETKQFFQPILGGYHSDKSEMSGDLFSEVSEKVKNLIEKLKTKVEDDKQAKFREIADNLVKELAERSFMGITKSKLIAFLIDKKIPEETLTSLYGINIWIDYINDKLGLKRSVKLTDRNPLPTGFRLEVFKRDKNKCVRCGRSPPEVKLHVDHIIPVNRGGTDNMENLQTLCDECNLNKKDMIL